MTLRVLVVGGPGRITTSTLAALVDDGHDVSVATRSIDDRRSVPGVSMHNVDRNDRGALAQLASRIRPEIVIDVCLMTPEQAEGVVEVFAGQVDQYLFLSTVDVYGYPLPSLPVSEDDPATRQNTPYAIGKREAEQMLVAGLADAATIIRVGYSFGSRFMISFISHAGGSVWIERLRAGLPVFVPDDGQRLIQPAHFADTGAMIHRLVADPRARGMTVNCAAYSTMTHDEYVGALADELGVSPRLAYLDVATAIELGGESVAQGLLPVLTGHDLAYATSRFREWHPDFVPKFDARSAMRDFISWHDGSGVVNAEVMDAEERLCEAARQS